MIVQVAESKPVIDKRIVKLVETNRYDCKQENRRNNEAKTIEKFNAMSKKTKTMQINRRKWY